MDWPEEGLASVLPAPGVVPPPLAAPLGLALLAPPLAVPGGAAGSLPAGGPALIPAAPPAPWFAGWEPLGLAPPPGLEASPPEAPIPVGPLTGGGAFVALA